MDHIVHYFRDAVAANGYLWFIEDSMNALFRINIETLKIEFVLSFPSEKTVCKRLCSTLIKCGDKLVCCPRYVKSIVIYDTVSGDTTKINLDFNGCDSKTVYMIGNLAIGDKVYLQRIGYSGIYQLNVQTGELCILDIDGKKMDLEENDTVWHWHWKMRKYRSDAEIILYDMKQNILYQYNIETLETKKLICFEKEQRLIDFETDGCRIWLLCCDGVIYKLEGNQIISEDKCGCHAVDELELLRYNNRIYLIKGLTGEIVQTLENPVVEDENAFNIVGNNTGLFASSYGADNCFWMQWNDGFFYYRDEANEVSGIFESSLGNIPAEAYLQKEVFHENKTWSLRRLLGITKHSTDDLVGNTENQTGETIYHAILED